MDSDINNNSPTQESAEVGEPEFCELVCGSTGHSSVENRSPINELPIPHKRAKNPPQLTAESSESVRY